MCNCQDLVGGEGEASVFRLNYSRPPTTWTRSKPTSLSIHNDEQDFYHLLAARVALYLHMSLTHSLMIIHQSERASTSDQITSNFLVYNLQLPHGRHGHHSRHGQHGRNGHGDHGVHSGNVGHVGHGGRDGHGGHDGLDRTGQDSTGQN